MAGSGTGKLLIHIYNDAFIYKLCCRRVDMLCLTCEEFLLC